MLRSICCASIVFCTNVVACRVWCISSRMVSVVQCNGVEAAGLHRAIGSELNMRAVVTALGSIRRTSCPAALVPDEGSAFHPYACIMRCWKATRAVFNEFCLISFRFTTSSHSQLFAKRLRPGNVEGLEQCGTLLRDPSGHVWWAGG